MTARLPYELIGATLAFSDVAELRAAACASRALQLQSELHLYRHSLLIGAGSVNGFYKVLTRCAERAYYVRALIVADESVSREELSRLLALLSSLEILQLRVCAQGIEVKAYPFKLQQLSIYADDDALAAGDFLRFLEANAGRALKRLEFPLSGDIARHDALCAYVSANPASLANLQTLRAPYNVMLAFVRSGAALRHIFASSGDVLGDEFFGAVEQANCDLRMLSGVKTEDGYAVLKTLAKVCPRMKSVELIMDDGRPVTTFAMNLLEHEVQEYPAVLPDLICLSVRVMSADGSLKPVSEGIKRGMLAGLGVCFPKLELFNGDSFQ
ncbi:hypothetical protein AURDEDRAFT_161052 [Auricularia subglabra TFB-10046 SS5]|nr:hypothetical protein AURDEDRAFT_161052 [Auricularia subglabra TFB-10046 SS5]